MILHPMYKYIDGATHGNKKRVRPAPKNAVNRVHRLPAISKRNPPNSRINIPGRAEA